MVIRCKKTKRFLCELNIEDYLYNLEQLGVSQEIPLKLVVPCRLCKESEEYYIYKDHYTFIQNVDRTNVLTNKWFGGILIVDLKCKSWKANKKHIPREVCAFYVGKIKGQMDT